MANGCGNDNAYAGNRFVSYAEFAEDDPARRSVEAPIRIGDIEYV